jgi:uncharacterized protein
MVSEAVDAAVGMLAQTERPHGGRTIEGLVTEIIRPMLKTWLDDNLPAPGRAPGARTSVAGYSDVGC